MNESEVTGTRKRKTGGGAALGILLFSSLAILLSIALLFLYVGTLFGRQSSLESYFQAVLTEESAVSMLQHDLYTGKISDYSIIPEYVIDDQRTSFEIIGIASTPPMQLEFSFNDDPFLSTVPAGETLFLITRDAVGMKVQNINLFDPECCYGESHVSWPSDVPPHSAAAMSPDGPVLFIAGCTDSRIDAAYISADGDCTAYRHEAALDGEDVLLTAGILEGSVALLVSDGSNSASLLVPDSASFYDVTSIPGTTPTILDTGELFGQTADGSIRYAADYGSRVRDIIRGDFTGDSREDVVFIGENRVVLLPFTGSQIVDSIPGGRPVAWGTAEEHQLLSVRWEIGGLHTWRIFMDGRFIDSPGPEFLPYPWEGEIQYSRQSMIGSVGDSVVYASETSGEMTAICSSDQARMFQLDGSTADILYKDGSTLKILLNPLDGNGLMLTMRSRTMGPEGVLLSENLWNVSVYGNGNGRRIMAVKGGSV